MDKVKIFREEMREIIINTPRNNRPCFNPAIYPLAVAVFPVEKLKTKKARILKIRSNKFVIV